DLEVRSVGLQPQNRRYQGRRDAHVAWSADRHVQQAVGSERDELPRVSERRIRQAITDYDRGRRGVEVPLDIIEPQELARSGHIERAVVYRDAIGLIEAAGDQHHPVGLVIAVA